jgi:hypothetical protein
MQSLSDYERLRDDMTGAGLTHVRPIVVVAGLAVVLAVGFLVAWPTFFCCRAYCSNESGQGCCGGKRPRAEGYTRGEVLCVAWVLLVLFFTAMVFSAFPLMYNYHIETMVDLGRDGVDGTFTDALFLLQQGITAMQSTPIALNTAVDAVLATLASLPLLGSSGWLSELTVPVLELKSAASSVADVAETGRDEAEALDAQLLSGAAAAVDGYTAQVAALQASIASVAYGM